MFSRREGTEMEKRRLTFDCNVSDYIRTLASVEKMHCCQLSYLLLKALAVLVIFSRTHPFVEFLLKSQP